MKRTPWFPAEIKPVRPGFYEVESANGSRTAKLFAVWTGREWAWPSDVRRNYPRPVLFFQNRAWRGVTEEPQ
jgi:hypothetical protein